MAPSSPRKIKTSVIEKFLKNRAPFGSHTSFDYCYNYFYSFYKTKKLKELSNRKNIQMSCLQLGFYLASWGMFRGRAPLRQKSIKYLEELIKTISKMNPKLWAIDCHNYTPDNIKLLIKCKDDIVKKLRKKKTNFNPTETLVTKIMLGVFGNIPAFDRNFKKSFGVNKVSETSLKKIKDFYVNNKKQINNYNKRIPTVDFKTNRPIFHYTKARIVDIYGFQKSSGK